MILFLFSLIAFAMKPTLSLNTTIGITQPYGNSMMYDIPIDYSTATVAGHDHEVYVAIGTNSGAASACAAVNGVPSLPGTSWTYGKFKVAGATAGTLHFIVYNMLPGTPYYFKAAVGNINAATPTWNVTCNGGVSIGTPALPTGLAELNLAVTHPTGTQASKYVLFDTDDCSDTSDTGANSHLENNVLIAVDPAANSGAGAIVWYLDVDAMSLGTKTTGWHYQPGTGTQTGRILAVVDHQYVYDWNFDGSENYQAIDLGDECEGGASDDGSCFSHDAFRSDSTGKTYAITTNESTVGPSGTGWDYAAIPIPDVSCAAGTSFFTDDGYGNYTGHVGSAATLNADTLLVADYGSSGGVFDPTNSPPNDGEGLCSGGYWSGDLIDPTIDWTHANSISAYRPGGAGAEYVDLSLKEWNQVARFDGMGALKWRLSGSGDADNFSPLTIHTGLTGTATFGDQHDVHTDTNGDLLMFDNTGYGTGSRGLRIVLTRAAGGGNPGNVDTADITQSWMMVDPAIPGNGLVCQAQGSSEMVGTSNLLMCNIEYTIEEFDAAAGDGATGHAPNLVIRLPATGVCGGDGYPSTRGGIKGWYRAYPIAKVGEY